MSDELFRFRLTRFSGLQGIPLLSFPFLSAFRSLFVRAITAFLDSLL